MKFKKAIFSAGATIALLAPVVTPSVGASANSKSNVNTEINSQERTISNKLQKLFNNIKGQLLPEVKNYQPQSNDGKQVKSTILQAAKSSNNQKQFKKAFKQGFKQQAKQQAMSKKDQLKQLKQFNKEMKKSNISGITKNSSEMRIAKRWVSAGMQISDGKSTIKLPSGLNTDK